MLGYDYARKLLNRERVLVEEQVEEDKARILDIIRKSMGRIDFEVQLEGDFHSLGAKLTKTFLERLGFVTHKEVQFTLFKTTRYYYLCGLKQDAPAGTLAQEFYQAWKAACARPTAFHLDQIIKRFEKAYEKSSEGMNDGTADVAAFLSLEVRCRKEDLDDALAFTLAKKILTYQGFDVVRHGDLMFKVTPKIEVAARARTDVLQEMDKLISL